MNYDDFQKKNIPSAIIQFVKFLFDNLPDVERFASTAPFLNALSSTLFPIEKDKNLHQQISLEVWSF